MEGTCKKENCPFWKEHEKKCPFFVETWWQDGQIGQVKLVEDCAPIRSMLMAQDLHNRFIGVQQANEEARNRFHDMTNEIRSINAMTKEFMELQRQNKEQIDSPLKKALDFIRRK